MQPDEFHHARRKFENQANSEKNAYSDEDGGENGKKDAHKRKHSSRHLAHRSAFFHGAPPREIRFDAQAAADGRAKQAGKTV